MLRKETVVQHETISNQSALWGALCWRAHAAEEVPAPLCETDAVAAAAFTTAGGASFTGFAFPPAATVPPSFQYDTRMTDGVGSCTAAALVVRQGFVCVRECSVL